jgi:hypothetical protein
MNDRNGRCGDASWIAHVLGRAAILLVVVAAGCGKEARLVEANIAPDAGYDHHFYSEPDSTETPSKELLAETIERLAGPAWAQARDELVSYGRPAVVALIENLDRTEPTQVTVRTLPGHSIPERTLTWPLGRVVYAVLLDFIGSYSTYDGRLPPSDKAAWEDWWRRNRKAIDLRNAAQCAPEYVLTQLDAIRQARSTRYSTKLAKAVKRAEAIKRQKEEAKRAKEEAKRLKAEERAKAKAEAQRQKEEALARRTEQQRLKQEAREKAEQEKAERQKAAREKAEQERAAREKAAREEADRRRAEREKARQEEPEQEQPEAAGQDDETQPPPEEEAPATEEPAAGAP